MKHPTKYFTDNFNWCAIKYNRQGTRNYFSKQDLSSVNHIELDEYIAWEQLFDVFTHI